MGNRIRREQKSVIRSVIAVQQYTFEIQFSAAVLKWLRTQKNSLIQSMIKLPFSFQGVVLIRMYVNFCPLHVWPRIFFLFIASHPFQITAYIV